MLVLAHVYLRLYGVLEHWESCARTAADDDGFSWYAIVCYEHGAICLGWVVGVVFSVVGVSGFLWLCIVLLAMVRYSVMRSPAYGVCCWPLW